MLRIFTQINYVSAKCGTGKTRSTIEFISNNLFHTNYLYVVPTQLLMNSVKEVLNAKGVTTDTISSDTHPDSVATSIVDYIKNARESEHVLIITWEAYKNIPYFNRRENWQVIIDEIPQVDRCHQFTIPRNIEKLSNNLEVAERVNKDLIRIIARDPNALRQQLEAVRDEVDETFRELFQHVLSHNYDTYVEADDWERLVEKREFSTSEKENQITFLSMLNPELFRGSILLGANVEDSLLFDWLKRFHRISAKSHQEISSGLDHTSKRKQCEIGYFFKNRNISKSLYKSTGDAPKPLIEMMDDIAFKHFGDEKFLFVANKDREKTALDGLSNVTRIPVISHGSNAYLKSSNIYFSAALNRAPKHLKLLKCLGFDMDQIRTAESHEITYQSVMRTSLRDPDSTEPVRLLVPDKFTAERLVRLIKGSHLVQIGNLDQFLKSKVPLTQAQKDQRSRSRKIKTPMVFPKSLPNPLYKRKGSQNGKLLGGQLKTCYVTTHEQHNRFAEQDCNVLTINTQDWIKHLRKMSKAVVDSKDELNLYCPSIFKSNPGAHSFKCHECFVQASFLVLDFDNGDVSPDVFIKEFGKDASTSNRHSFLIMNSWSRSDEEPNRFRVIMFFKRPASSIEEYQACFDYIVERLEEAGFPPKASGLDRNSRSPAQSYYFPGMNRSLQEWAFFEKHWTKTRELERHGIDPYAISATKQPKLQLSHANVSITSPNKQKYRKRADELKVLIMGKDEGRHTDQYLLGVELKKSGASNYQIAEELFECLGRTPQTEKKIRDTLKSLDKWNAGQWFT